jgi:hypothetical protein
MESCCDEIEVGAFPFEIYGRFSARRMNKVKYRIHLRAPPKGLAIRAVDRELELGQGGPFALLGKKTKRRALKPSGTWRCQQIDQQLKF